MAVAPLSISAEDVLKDQPLSLLSPRNPSPEETIFLSNIDLAVAFTVETVYFFEVDDPAAAAEIWMTVERAVAVLLVPYYFLAGRLRVNRDSGRLELVCNNAGVLFVKAETRVRLRELGDLAVPNPSFCHFVHRPGLHRTLSERPLFTIQVTKLGCGGFAIGMVTNHGVVDGKSAADMFQNLASLCRGHGLKTQTISNDRTCFKARTPPRITHPHHEYTAAAAHLPSAFTAVTKPSPTPSPPLSAAPLHRLIPFSPAAVAALKRSAAVPSCSTFHVILAQLWRARTLALFSDRPGETSTVLFAVDIRSKLCNPALPDGFVGNAVMTGYAAATAAAVAERPLAFCVEKVKEGIERVSEEEYVRSAIDWLEVYGGIPATCNGNSFYVSAWWKLPFKELDFGFGELVHGGPVANGNAEFVLLLSPPPAKDGDNESSAVNVWISLENETMKKFMLHIFEI